MPTPSTNRLQQACGMLVPALCLALLAAIPWMSRAGDNGSPIVPDPKPIPQPVPFSHRTHTELGLQCAACHAMKGRGGSAGFPSLSLCLTCHRNAKGGTSGLGALLEGYEQRGEAIPWVRVYKIPDFVFFSHQQHLDSGATCTTCHGAVEMRDTLKQEVPTSMEYCMDCHQSRGASVACHFCHELNQ